MEGDRWGFRSPTPRGRTESCTLRILTDALTSAHEKHCTWGGSRGWGRRGEVEGRGCALTNQRGRYAPRSPNSAVRRSPHATAQALSYSRRLAHSRRAWVSRCGAAAFLSIVPQGALPPCIFFTILSREHQKSIRRMRGVQDSVLPEGRGGEASPHIPLIHQSTDAQHRNPQRCQPRNPQGRQARNPQRRQPRNPRHAQRASPMKKWG